MIHTGRLSVHAGEFETIITAYYEDIYKFCCWKIRDPTEAQDITQDTFIRFMNAAETYADIERPKALLYTIAKNLCLNWINRARPKSLDGLEAGYTPSVNDFSDESVQKTDLYNALSALPDDRQEILLLRYGQELKVNEIAEILGLSRFQVMYQIRGALNQLRKSLKANFQIYSDDAVNRVRKEERMRRED